MRVPDNKYCRSTSKESGEKFFGIAEDLPLGSQANYGIVTVDREVT